MCYGIVVKGGASSMQKILKVWKAMLRIMTLSTPRKYAKLLQQVFTNKEEYFTHNYDHIYNTRQKNTSVTSAQDKNS